MLNKVTTWGDMKMQNIPLNEIKEGSKEYEIMKDAAENGDPSAQHSMGMWEEIVACNGDEAKKWYKKAAEKRDSAKDALEDLDNNK